MRSLLRRSLCRAFLCATVRALLSALCGSGREQKHRIDEGTLYRGIGYLTHPGSPHINARVVRKWPNGAFGVGQVVGYMPEGDTGEEELWLVVHEDGDREDLDR